jgi:hypothetical protein
VLVSLGILWHGHPQLSLGDARSYFLSTAANHLGVISATSAAGKSVVSSFPSFFTPLSLSRGSAKGKDHINPIHLTVPDPDLDPDADSEG